MITMPGVMPVTRPVLGNTVAIAGALLLQLPPGVGSVSVVVNPTQMLDKPLITPGRGFTVTIAVAEQPVGSVYEIVTVPAATPVTTPDDDPTVAIRTLLLLHVPPQQSNKLVVPPTHTDMVPDIADGGGFTVTVTVAEHPDPTVYDIVVIPADMPVATPVTGSMNAMEGSRLLQKPPGVASVNVDVEPIHKFVLPRIGAGSALTVTENVA